MAEKLTQIPLAELLRPTVTPEMGFQAYELLGDSAEKRKAQENAVLRNEVMHPHVEYPLIDVSKLNHSISELDRVLQRAQNIEDPVVASAVWDTVAYRMAEMYFLLEAKRLSDLSTNPD